MSSPLANRTYRHLFSAQVIALVGNGLSTIALALLAYDLAGNDAGVVLGTALAIKMVAYVGIAPVFAGYAHRFPRRGLLIALDIGRAGIIGCLPFVTEIWQIYILIFLLNAFSAGFTPAFQSAIPDILTDEAQYTRALSLSRLAYDLENLLSPMVAAAALMVMSYNALFAANALAFVLSAFLVLSVSVPPASPPERRGSVRENALFGIMIYLRTPRLRGVLALALATAAAGAMVIVNTVVYVRDRLGGSESDTAFAFAAVGAGSMMAALAVPRLLDAFSDRALMLAGGIMLTAGLSLGALGPGATGLLLIWFVLGMGSSLVQTPTGRLLRRSTSDGDLTAVFAAQFALSHLCWLIAYAAAGWLGGWFGLLPVFVVMAVVAFSATFVAAILWPRGDTLVLEHHHDMMEHEHLHTHGEHHDHAHEGWEGEEPHSHPHRHAPLRHSHHYVIDLHHPVWPTR